MSNLKNKTRKSALIAMMAIMCMIFAMTNEAKAQPGQYPVNKASYVNVPSSLIPTQETLLLPLLWGDLFYRDVVTKKQQNYCNSALLPESGNASCDTKDPNQWKPWQDAVYKFTSVGIGSSNCVVTVEYQYRNCTCDPKRTQHNIIGIHYETTWLPWPFSRVCNSLHSWLTSGTDAEIQEKYFAFYEDMYQKLAMQAFVDAENIAVDAGQERIYCGSSNQPIKTHHVKGACEGMCIQTFHIGDKVYTTIRRDACFNFDCCIFEITTCRDAATGEIKNTTSLSSNNQSTQQDCNSMGSPYEGEVGGCSGGETNLAYDCKFTCDDIDRHRFWCLDNDYYPYKDIYSNNVYPLRANEKQAVKTWKPGKDGMFGVYPNPTSKVLNIEFDGGIEDITAIKVTDNLGQVLLNTLDGNIALSKEIDISKLTNGTYFIILTIDGIEYTKYFTIVK